MRQLSQLVRFVSLFLVSAFVVTGQDFEETDLAPDATITKRTIVLSRPSFGSPTRDTLALNTSIRVIQNKGLNGYYRVLYGDGAQGYVPQQNVRLPQLGMKKASDSLLMAIRRVPCAGSLNQCPSRGCYDPGTNEALFNEAKTRPPIGRQPTTVTFADMRRLQDIVGTRLKLRSQNKVLTREERSQLQNITVANGVVGESSLVRITGYIASGNDLKAGSIETVNCRLDKPEQKDIHIPLVPRPGSTAYQGIVIEMIPQKRPQGWHLAALRLVRDRMRKVLVIGGLFYDNEHVVNDNPSYPVPGHSKRFSIWEIHPVTRFMVCERPNNSCSEESSSGWTSLEYFGK